MLLPIILLNSEFAVPKQCEGKLLFRVERTITDRFYAVSTTADVDESTTVANAEIICRVLSYCNHFAVSLLFQFCPSIRRCAPLPPISKP